MTTSAFVLITLALRVVAAKKHVIRSPQLDQSLELGEVLAEKTVESAAACGQLCAADPVCHTVMLIGQRCLLYSFLHPQCPPIVTTDASCPAIFAPIDDYNASLYVYGKDFTVKSFVTAFSYCSRLGGHSVHINDEVEHSAIVKLISGDPDCKNVWTGGWTDKPGTDPVASAWKWIISLNDLDSVPMTYMNWAEGQPNNDGGEQRALALRQSKDFTFTDLGTTDYDYSCYLCECP